MGKILTMAESVNIKFYYGHFKQNCNIFYFARIVSIYAYNIFKFMGNCKSTNVCMLFMFADTAVRLKM